MERTGKIRSKAVIKNMRRIGGVCVMITGGKAGINRGEWRG